MLAETLRNLGRQDRLPREDATLKLSQLLTISTFLMFVSGVPAISAAPLTLVVNNGTPGANGCPKANFKTIQAALSYSRDGDTIYVCTGDTYVYPEQVIVNHNVTLTAQSGVEIQPTTFTANTTKFTDGSALAAAVLVTPATGAKALVSATVSGFQVDGTFISGCTPGFAGIVYTNASGTVTHNAVTNIQVSGSNNGCQTGIGIYGQSDGSFGMPNLAVTQNSVHDYQKGGIVVTGGLTATVNSNYVRGYGPVSFIAQNGIEFGYGLTSTSTLTSNNVTGNIYTGTDTQSTDILLLSDGITSTSNTVSDGDTGIYSSGNGATITKNSVSNTTYDGIYFFDGAVTSNVVADTQARNLGWAIEYAGTTTTSSVASNTILDAYVGVATDNSGASLVITPVNRFFDVSFPMFAFNETPPTGTARARSHVSPVPSPFTK